MILAWARRGATRRAVPEWRRACPTVGCSGGGRPVVSGRRGLMIVPAAVCAAARLVSRKATAAGPCDRVPFLEEIASGRGRRRRPPGMRTARGATAATSARHAARTHRPRTTCVVRRRLGAASLWSSCTERELVRSIFVSWHRSRRSRVVDRRDHACRGCQPLRDAVVTAEVVEPRGPTTAWSPCWQRGMRSGTFRTPRPSAPR